MQIENILGIMVPIIALMIPIVAILAKHQQNMADRYAQNQLIQPQSNPEMGQMREEMRLLREQLNQQSILLDDIRSQNQNLQERVNENA